MVKYFNFNHYEDDAKNSSTLIKINPINLIYKEVDI